MVYLSYFGEVENAYSIESYGDKQEKGKGFVVFKRV